MTILTRLCAPAARLGEQLFERAGARREPRDAQPGGRRRNGRVGVGEQFLVQFLAGPQPAELDADVVDLGAREPDHVARQVEDLHWLAHVERQHLPGLTDRGRLQHQARCFGDRHEEADDVGGVTVIGPPRAICSLNFGMTLPDDPGTLPNRTAMKRVPSCSAARDDTAISATRFVAPITLVGFMALSVLINAKRSAPARAEASAALQVPSVLSAASRHRSLATRYFRIPILVAGAGRTAVLESPDIKKNGTRSWVRGRSRPQSGPA